MNELINYGGVCRTAPATPGLLNIRVESIKDAHLDSQVGVKLEAGG